MTLPAEKRIRDAVMKDGSRLVALWELLFDETDGTAQPLWRSNALAWFARVVGDSRAACFPVAEVDGSIVATAIGTLELGVPNPYCPRGRTVRLANVVTLPAHRGNGYATLLVRGVIEWARAVDADRVDLSATREGQRIYERAGFVPTSAPRMKLVLFDRQRQDGT
jgi:GNAT superfamily N-acetyltransferase